MLYILICPGNCCLSEISANAISADTVIFWHIIITLHYILSFNCSATLCYSNSIFVSDLSKTVCNVPILFVYIFFI